MNTMFLRDIFNLPSLQVMSRNKNCKNSIKKMLILNFRFINGIHSVQISSLLSLNLLTSQYSHRFFETSSGVFKNILNYLKVCNTRRKI